MRQSPGPCSAGWRRVRPFRQEILTGCSGPSHHLCNCSCFVGKDHPGHRLLAPPSHSERFFRYATGPLPKQRSQHLWQWPPSGRMKPGERGHVMHARQFGQCSAERSVTELSVRILQRSRGPERACCGESAAMQLVEHPKHRRWIKSADDDSAGGAAQGPPASVRVITRSGASFRRYRHRARTSRLSAACGCHP